MNPQEIAATRNRAEEMLRLYRGGHKFLQEQMVVMMFEMLIVLLKAREAETASKRAI